MSYTQPYSTYLPEMIVRNSVFGLSWRKHLHLLIQLLYNITVDKITDTLATIYLDLRLRLVWIPSCHLPLLRDWINEFTGDENTSFCCFISWFCLNWVLRWVKPASIISGVKAFF